MAGTSAATFCGTSGGKEDISAAVEPEETIVRCLYWLRLYVELDLLTARFGVLEESLCETYSWLSLSKEQQLTRPEGQEFRQIEARIKEICEQRLALMEEAPALRATTPAAILAKLALAQQLVWPDDYPEAHDLIGGCVKELTEMLPYISFRPPQGL